MSEGINIKWIGPDRNVPGCGWLKCGATRKINKEAANSLVRQGLAEYINSKSKGEEKPSKVLRKNKVKEE